MQDTVKGKIINAANEVHKILGWGLLDSIYEEALCYEFTLSGIQYKQQALVDDVPYKDKLLHGKRQGLLVDNQIAVEIKVLRELSEVSTAQIFSFLKAVNLKRGLLINFGETVSTKDITIY